RKKSIFEGISQLSWKQIITMTLGTYGTFSVMIGVFVICAFCFITYQLLNWRSGFEKRFQQEIQATDIQQQKFDQAMVRNEINFDRAFQQNLKDDHTQENTQQKTINTETNQMAFQQGKDAMSNTSAKTLATTSSEKRQP
ncbi:MAG: hypothetical protein ACK4PR_05040, partial [Gammaproteobacteria bacterium]